jgi:hypothetical protein
MPKSIGLRELIDEVLYPPLVAKSWSLVAKNMGATRSHHFSGIDKQSASRDGHISVDEMSWHLSLSIL